MRSSYVAMDVIKKEPEFDPLAMQWSDETDTTKKKPIPEEENLSDLHVAGIKTECVDHSNALTSEIKVEETSVTTDLVLIKCEVEVNLFVVDRVQQEQKVEVSLEDDGVERIAATNERTVSSEFDSVLEENKTVCEIPKNSDVSEKSARTGEDEKQFEFELPKICFTSCAKLSGYLPKDAGKHFKCDVRGKNFSRSSYGTREHPHTRKKRFKCDVCGKRLSRSDSLKTHNRVHTGEKPFNCFVCGKDFSTSSNLKSHERLHTGEKPFKCNLCGKHFLYYNSLKSHKLSHKGEKLFKCDFCGKVLSSSSILKRHVRLHTDKKPLK
ncbi:zinc finger protein 722-like isoform X3 [Periplaneta americana]|uniref:zinc finger protein 722-like isoform X3 n=1 Tax=Periplaneta americana TaxID=6978 RepID=UPI0037E99571